MKTSSMLLLAAAVGGGVYLVTRESKAASQSRIFGMDRGASKFAKTKVGDMVRGTLRYWDEDTKKTYPAAAAVVRVETYDSKAGKFRGHVVEVLSVDAYAAGAFDLDIPTLVGKEAAIRSVPDSEDETA